MLSIDRITAIVDKYFEATFVYNSIICIDEDFCLVFQGDGQEPKTIPFDKFVEIGKSLVHPLFVQRYEAEMNREHLEFCHRNNKLTRADVLLLDPIDHEYHWHRLRIVPIDDGEHITFFFNFLPIDNDIRDKEKIKDDIFNKAVMQQLVYNYILVYAIDLSNEMSHLVFTNHTEEYDEYAEKFSGHAEMIKDLFDKYIDEEFKPAFSRFLDYSYIRTQFEEEEKDRLVFIFRDIRGQAFEMSFSKFPEYSKDYPLTIFAIKELD